MSGGTETGPDEALQADKPKRPGPFASVFVTEFLIAPVLFIAFILIFGGSAEYIIGALFAAALVFVAFRGIRSFLISRKK